MAVAAIETARLTSDPVAPEQLQGDIARLFDALAVGGIGIVPLDVAYAVVATMPNGIRRIFEAKRRSYDKPSGMFGNWRLSREIHVMDEQRHGMVREIVEAGANSVFGRGAVPRRSPLIRRSRSVRDAEFLEGRHAGYAAQCRPVPRRHRRRLGRARHGRIRLIRELVAHRQQISLPRHRSADPRRCRHPFRLRQIEICPQGRALQHHRRFHGFLGYPCRPLLRAFERSASRCASALL